MSLTAILQSPNPNVAAHRVATALGQLWGLEGVTLSELGSSQDQNFRVHSASGRYVLKLANAAATIGELELQNAAMRHIAAAAVGCQTPLPVATPSGADVVEIDGHRARLSTWVDGAALSERRWSDRRGLDAVGDVAARCTLGLADFDHPELDRELQWDPRHALRVFDEIGASISDAAQAALLNTALTPIRDLVTDGLPVQAVHLDVTDYNVVADQGLDGSVRRLGVVDFGDVVRSWRVADAAHAAMSATFHSLDDPLGGALAVISAYHRRNPLLELEANAVWALVLARAAVCAMSSTHQARLTGKTAHLARLMAEDWAALEAVAAVSVNLAVAAVRSTCGYTPLPRTPAIIAALAAAAPAPLVTSGQPIVAVDLSVTSECLSAGDWRSAERVAEVVAVDGVAAGRWGEVRILHAGAPADTTPDTLHLGVDLFLAPGTRVHAPLPGHVIARHTRELLIAIAPADESLLLRVSGVTPSVAVGTDLDAGVEIAVVASDDGLLGPHVHVQLCAGGVTCGLGAASLREALLALCPDPSPLLGAQLSAPAPAERDRELARRQANAAKPQKLFYCDPPLMLRGAGSTVYDAAGRPYIDAVNNMQEVGHSHPRIAGAARRALTLFNGNSRFLHPDMGRYAERLAALLPDELSAVFLVNSGSEAVELALRLAREVTGRADVIALEGAYHGWTAGSFGISTFPEDRPGGVGAIPLPGLRVVAQPDPLRGRFGADAEPYIADVATACAPGAGPAAMISEPLLGNQGGVEPPAGYLAGAYERVRAAGGLCIADEVQVGLGRTGTDLWAFEHEAVVPDIVCTAKGAGNGFPLGAVICRREIAESLSASFFSSPGGSPVACAVGLAVLDVLEREQLQRNALEIGTRLRVGLTALAAEQPEIGAVLGRGLFMGVDLIRDGDLSAPADQEAIAICEEALQRGLVIQPTGDHGNVLKLKPPLTIDERQADRILTVIDAALNLAF